MRAVIGVFINDQRVEVTPGGSVADAVAGFDATLAAKVRDGTACLTDGRGIRLESDAPAFHGCIIRVIVTARTGTPRNEADAHA